MTRRRVGGRVFVALAALALALVAVPALAAGQGALRTIRYGGEGSLKETYGDLGLVVDSIVLAEDQRVPRLRIFVGGKRVLTIRFDTPAGDTPTATVKLVDLAVPGPQVVFQRFTQGAHCCVETKIAVQHEGVWTTVDGDLLDGDSGYDFRDIDGGGVKELVGADESFVEAFSDYASSFAPIRIQTLDGARLVDVTAAPRFRGAVVRQLEILQDENQNGAQWDNNGFLAAWVATKMLLGEGDDAWIKMLKTYDKDPAIPLEVCDDPVPLPRCRDGHKHAASFPEALRAHLLTHGYIKDASAFPVPGPSAAKRSAE